MSRKTSTGFSKLRRKLKHFIFAEVPAGASFAFLFFLLLLPILLSMFIIVYLRRRWRKNYDVSKFNNQSDDVTEKRHIRSQQKQTGQHCLGDVERRYLKSRSSFDYSTKTCYAVKRRFFVTISKRRFGVDLLFLKFFTLVKAKVIY